MIQTWVFKILIILHPSPGACSQTISWTLALKELSAALSGNKGVVWRGFKSRRSCKHLQTSQMLCFCKLRICDLVSALDMKRLKKVQVSVALKEFEAVDFVTRAIADVFFDASAVQTWSDLSFDPASSITDVDSVCALSQMSWFSKKYQQFASVWCLSLRFCMSTLKAMSSNVKQCQAAKQAGVTLWVQTESGVEDLATPKMLEDFSPCDRVTTPRLPKIPDLKQQMVPDHKAAICCNWSCGACRLLRWFTIRKSWTGQTLISENMWPVKQVILLAECTKHLAVCLKSMFMHISHSVLRWKLGRAALDAEAVRRQFF